MMFEGFEEQTIEVEKGVRLRTMQKGKGPALLLLHGYPQSLFCWHKLAPKLVDAGFRVILSDLRGYGGSDKPESDDQHLTYSKREMAADQASLMAKLGHQTYGVIGHDRGGRVAHRLARDFPDHVSALCVLDIAPTEVMYGQTDKDFATSYYHWFFLIQPHPLPERLIGNDAEYYLRSKLYAWSKQNKAAFDEQAIADYFKGFDQAGIHASCEDYRAAATIDLEHDKEDKDKKLEMPVQALWGDKGVVHRSYDVLDVWRQYADNVTGKSLPCGHFLPEECPDETANELIGFFSSQSS